MFLEHVSPSHPAAQEQVKLATPSCLFHRVTIDLAVPLLEFMIANVMYSRYRWLHYDKGWDCSH